VLVCPFCGSSNLRYSRVQTPQERLWIWVGVRPLRCRDCRKRFRDRTRRAENIRYARCPNCWRMDLSRWSAQDYQVGMVRRLLLWLGANPWRCEYCRCNFVSFRPRKMKFSSRQAGRARRVRC